jgi:hypothetical protein
MIMRSLKIILLLAVLVSIFVLTVSGVSEETETLKSDSFEKIDKSEHQITGPVKRKNGKPSNA